MLPVQQHVHWLSLTAGWMHNMLEIIFKLDGNKLDVVRRKCGLFQNKCTEWDSPDNPFYTTRLGDHWNRPMAGSTTSGDPKTPKSRNGNWTSTRVSLDCFVKLNTAFLLSSFPRSGSHNDIVYVESRLSFVPQVIFLTWLLDRKQWNIWVE